MSTDTNERDADFDFLVVGGGSAGPAAAAEAVKRGVGRVAMVNDGELGGLCILRGCMPTKALLASSDVAHEARHGARLGMDVAVRGFDWPAILDRKRRQIARFQRAKIASVESGGYELVDGRARFVGPDAVQVGDRRITARAFLISTGSRQHVPPIPGLDEVPYWTSDDLLELERPPGSLVALGAGAIGLEFTTFLAGLGVPCTLLARSGFPNSAEEPDLARHYVSVMEAAGVRTHTGARLERVERTASGVRVHCVADGRQVTVEAERLLLATGRVANLEGLGLEAAHVRTDGSDQLFLDDCLRTTNPRIFAAGDATNRDLVLHTGNAEGRHTARNVARLLRGEEPAPWREEVPVRAIFTHPPYAQCGHTAREAAAAGLAVVTAQKEWANQGRGIVMGIEPGHGFAKLIAEVGTGRLVGCQLLGPRADDLIHVISTAMHLRATAADLVAMPWYHPTLSEVFIELGREVDAKARA